jgi:hypothetical protein
VTGRRLREGLAELFPIAPPVRLTRTRVLAGLSLVLLAAGAQILRLPGSLDTLWAEDGLVFLQQARTVGRLHAFVQPYAGYLHVIPRMVAAVVASVPPRFAAIAFTSLSAVVVGGLALVIFVAARAHIPSVAWRLVLSGTFILLPVAGVELLDTGVNLQWYAMCALFWALLWRPQGVWPRTIQVILCFATTASDPLTALFLPLAAARVIAVRPVKEQAPVLAWAAGLLAQGVTTLVTSVPHSNDHASLALLGRLFSLRILTPLFLGDHGTQIVFAHGGWLPVYLCTAAALAALTMMVLAVVRGRLSRRLSWFAAAAVLTAVLFFAVPVETRWTPLYLPVGRSAQFLGIGSRYMALPLVALWSLAILVLATHWRMRIVRVAGVVSLGAFLCMWALDFVSTDSARLTGPRWGTSLSEAAVRCRETSTGTIAVVIPPANGLWTVTLPCADLPAP